MKLMLGLLVLCVATAGCSPAAQLRMARGATDISTELHDRYGVQPNVHVNLQNGTVLQVTVTLPLKAVRTYSAEQLHEQVMAVATKHLDKRPDDVFVIIANSE